MRKFKKVLSLVVALSMSASMVVGIVPTAMASTPEQTLVNEAFDSSIGGFTGISRVTISNPAAAYAGMTNNVVQFDATSSTNPVGYAKTLDATVSDKNFATLEFDIAALPKATNRNLHFGAYDSNNNPLFRLNMKENAVAAISINGGSDTAVTGMTQLNSYRVKATFNFITKKQTIKIVPSTDLTATPLLDATYDITSATNLAKLGMPVNVTYVYGKIQLDNLLITTPATNEAKFVAKDQNGDVIANADLLIGATALKTDANGVAIINLSAGSYNIDASLFGYDKVTTPFDITDSDKEIAITMNKLAYIPEATTIAISDGQDYIYKPLSGTNTTSAYTATVSEQSGYLMPTETVTWSIDPAVTGVSVDASTGIVSVDNSVAIPTDDGIDVMVKATSTSKNTTVATKSLHIRNVKAPAKFDIIGMGSIKTGESATYTIANVIDQYGEPANVADYQFTLESNSDKAIVSNMTITAGVIDSETPIVITATSGTYSSTKNIILHNYVFLDSANGYTPYYPEARYGLIGTENTLVWPNATKTTTYTFPQSIQLELGKAITVSWKNAWTVQIAGSQIRRLTIKDSAGANVVPTLSVAGSVIGFGDTKANNVYSVNEPLGNMGVQNTWYDFTMTIKTDLEGNSVAVVSFAGGDSIVKTIPAGVTNISSMTFYTDSGLPSDRLIGVKNIKIENAQVQDVEVTGATSFAKISGQTVTRQYTPKIFATATGETFKWSLASAYEGASIDAFTGILSIADTTTPGVVRVVYTSDLDATKTNYLDVTIKDFADITDFTINGSTLLGTGDTGSISVSNIVDEYGDTVTFTPTYTVVEGSDVATVTQDGVITVGNNYGIVKINVTLGNPGKELTKQFAFNVAKFNEKYIVASGETSHTFDVSTLANATNNTDYNITVISKDSGKVTISSNGTELFSGEKSLNASQLETVQTVNAVDGKVTVDFTGNVYSIEISPNFKFDFGAGAVATGYISVSATSLFDGVTGYGFNTTGATNGTSTKDGDLDSDVVSFGSTSFDVALPDGVYEFIFTKGNSARASISVNKNTIGMNVDMGGWGKGTNGSTYRVSNVTVKGGKASVRLSSPYSTALSSMVIRKVSNDTVRKTHIYVAGDSTVCNYFPIDYWTDPAGGTAQTGWASLLKNYVSNDMEVVNLAASGSWAAGWYSTMKSVIENSRPGDYFIVQFGINDSKNTGNTVMLEYIDKMVDDCVANGIIPIVVTPQNAGSGGSPTLIKDYATQKGVLFVDLSTLAGKMSTDYGSTFVSQNYHGWNFTTNTLSDGTHWSYIGAKKVGELFTTDVARQIAENVKDTQGNTFAGIKLNPQYSYIFDNTAQGGVANNLQVTATSFKNLISTVTDMKLWAPEFRDASGNTMYVPQGNVVANVKAENLTVESKTVTFVVATYDSNGRMVSISSSTNQINPLSATNLTSNITIPTGGTSKVMVFNSLSNIKPLYIAQ